MTQTNSANSANASTLPNLKDSVLRGGLGFLVASLLVFGSVAFAEGWMYRNLTLAGAYIVWTLAFILVGGWLLGSLVVGRWRRPRFYLLFAGAFLLYACGWVGAYFTMPSLKGELLGSLVGSVLMAVAFTVALRATGSLLKVSLVLFVANSVGYFLGSALNDLLQGSFGMLLWGTAYGLSLGAGLGAVLHMAQAEKIDLQD